MEPVTIILTVWKRNYLLKQLYHIINQNVQPAEIWIIQNEYHIDVGAILKMVITDIKIHHFHLTKNLKYFARFSLANLVNTEFVWLIDDDVMPGEFWMEFAIEKCKELSSVITCAGRILNRMDYRPEEISSKEKLRNFVGDVSDKSFCYSLADTIVDYGIQSYFLKTEWLKAFWGIYPCTFETGEDIHLAASVKQQLGINTVVPKQISKAYSGNVQTSYGMDEFASWKTADFINKREHILRYHIDTLCWIPIKWI